jgi:hypothetical protein
VLQLEIGYSADCLASIDDAKVGRAIMRTERPACGSSGRHQLQHAQVALTVKRPRTLMRKVV